MHIKAGRVLKILRNIHSLNLLSYIAEDPKLMHGQKLPLYTSRCSVKRYEGIYDHSKGEILSVFLMTDTVLCSVNFGQFIACNCTTCAERVVNVYWSVVS